jgi:hypothetical protein
VYGSHGHEIDTSLVGQRQAHACDDEYICNKIISHFLVDAHYQICAAEMWCTTWLPIYLIWGIAEPSHDAKRPQHRLIRFHYTVQFLLLECCVTINYSIPIRSVPKLTQQRKTYRTDNSLPRSSFSQNNIYSHGISPCGILATYIGLKLMVTKRSSKGIFNVSVTENDFSTIVRVR